MGSLECNYMEEFRTIEIQRQGPCSVIYLNRPEIHNAFNEEMISELLRAFRFLGEDAQTRVIQLRGRGKSFCAGADLNWMRGVAGYSYEQNYAESLQLAECFYAIYTCPKPTLAIVHGAAIGGANGLLAACDIAWCEENTVFSLSEVKIGIIPACISPYVIKRVGEYGAKDLMLTGRRIKGPEAAKYGLVSASFSADELEKQVESTVSLLLSSGPEAIRQCKDLVFQICNEMNLEQALPYTAKMIADIRQSEEGQEGMAAFLSKRSPNWIP